MQPKKVSGIVKLYEKNLRILATKAGFGRGQPIAPPNPGFLMILLSQLTRMKPMAASCIKRDAKPGAHNICSSRMEVNWLA